MRLLPLLLLAGCPTSEDVYSTTACIDVADTAVACPAAADVDPALAEDMERCDGVVTEVSGEGSIEPWPWLTDDDLACCYDGRAYDARPDDECQI